MGLLLPESALLQISVVFIITQRKIFLLDFTPGLLTLGRCRIRISIDKMLKFIYGNAVRDELQTVPQMVKTVLGGILFKE
ncbi:hypothetical protein D3C76_204490 [compost metagenome]